jgi:phage shock protein E
MNHRLKIMLASAFLLCVTGPVVADNGETENSSNQVPVKQVKGDITAAEQAWVMINNGALVIDVRSEGEFDAGHLEGALNIVHTDTDALAAAIGEDLDRPVVFYCGSGRRAGLAKTILEESGYSGIYNASGYEALLETQP